LEQVCVKAGLHPSLWKEDDTALVTFEGLSVRGSALPEGATHAPAEPFLLPGELAAYADFCRGNLTALLCGALPNYSFLGAPDGNVSAVVLTVGRAGSADPLQLSRISLRPAVALQATLFQLT